MAQTKRISERSHTSNCSINPISTQSSESRIATTSNSLSDRSERAVAALLTRFKTLVTLAAEPVQDGDAATKEVAAAHALQMEVESSLLVFILTASSRFLSVHTLRKSIELGQWRNRLIPVNYGSSAR
ncbi:hypothetical protein B2J93_3540 [Marssonina coronariae]|uniref:Uncharacterized protein n=1 Tax=Diplocarpon coronariae TaxID=2795749 RepID=A0A218Z5U3_9HELO|nr:hypothetical protein B2J93_3540 [Marssonina coronariae]